MTKKVSGRQIRERNYYKDGKNDRHDDIDDDDADDADDAYPNLPIESELSDVLAVEDQSRVCPILEEKNPI